MSDRDRSKEDIQEELRGLLPMYHKHPDNILVRNRVQFLCDLLWLRWPDSQ